MPPNAQAGLPQLCTNTSHNAQSMALRAAPGGMASSNAVRWNGPSKALMVAATSAADSP